MPQRDLELWFSDEVPDERAGEAMCSLVRTIEQRQAARHRRDRLHATLYADQPVRGTGPFAYLYFDDEPDCARLNLIKAVTDTWVSAMVKSTPKPQTITQKGNWSLMRKGKGLNLWLDGQYDELKVASELMPLALRGAGIFGTSFVKVFEDVPGGLGKKAAWDEAKVGLDIVRQDQVTVADAEAQNPRNIRSLFVRQWYDVEQLCEIFPDKKSEIRDAPKRIASTVGADGYAFDEGTNMIEVVEGYHRRSSRVSKDGVRCIGIPTCTLARVPWEGDRFPLVPIRRAIAPFGLFGIGIPQELRGSQTTINEIMLAYEEAMIFFARPKWMVPVGSNVSRDHLDDRIGSVVEFQGPVAPQMYVPNVVMPSDVIEILQLTWGKGFETTGTNQILAGGQVPAGLKSGEAIERYNDTGAARGLESVKAYEGAHVELAELMIESARQIAKRNPKFASTFMGKRRTEIVYFAKVDPGKDAFRLKVQPVNAIGSTISGKYEDIEQLRDWGLIDERTIRLLLDWPDLDEENELALAPFRVIEKILADIEESDDPGAVALDARNTPSPNWPLDFMKARCMYAHAHAFVNNAPAEYLDAIDTYLDRVEMAIDESKPKASPMLGAPQAPALAAPPGQPGLPQLPPGPAPAGVVPPPPAGAPLAAVA